MTISASAKDVTVTVHLENRGDSAAHDVRTLLSILDQRLASETVTRLPPGKALKISYFRKVDPVPKGSFPAVLLTDYADETGTAFSALHVAAFDTKPGIRTNLVTQTAPAEIAKSAKLRLTVENPGDRARDIRVRLILPREFTGKDRNRVFLLDSGEQRGLDFTVENRSALEGAAYSAAFMAEYDEDYVHHTVVAESRLTVVPERGLLGRLRPLWWAVLGLCVLGFIIALLRRKGLSTY